MPQEFKKFENPMDDGRRKLDPLLHNEIIEKYKGGMHTWQTLADQYGVSKKLIGLILNPAMKAKQVERNKETWHEYSTHYGKEYHRLSIAKLRAKKIVMGLNIRPLRNNKASVKKEGQN